MEENKLSKAELTQIENIEKQSGKKMAEWTVIVNKSGFQKHGEIIQLLKEKYGFTHGNANMIAHISKQSFAGASAGDDLIEAQYKGKENLRPLYDKLMTEIQKFGNDIELAPKKGYMSLRRKKQFAIIQPSSKTRLDVGLNIKGVEAKGILEPGSSWNAMCTHRIKIDADATISPEVIKYMKDAYDQAG